MSAMLRDISAFKLALGTGVVVAGATGAFWYHTRRRQTPCPAKTPGESPREEQPKAPTTEAQTAVKTAVESKDPPTPAAAEKQVSVDHGEETLKPAQRISIQIPSPPAADGEASVESLSPDNLSISDTFEKVSPSQLGSQSNTPPALSTPPYPPKDTESLGESFGSTALGESFEQVSLGSQLKEKEKEELKDASPTEEVEDEAVREEPALKEEEVNDTVHVTTEAEAVSAQDETDSDEAPLAVFPPDFNTVDIPDGATILLMDLETTGFGNARITQVAVMEHGGEERSFMRYVLPRQRINPAAAELTGITMVRRRDGTEVMMARGEVVDAVSLRVMVEEFLRWMDDLRPVVMLAHNGRTFDFRILLKALESIDQLEGFCDRVTTFADTLPLFKKKVVGRRSYKLESMASDVLGVPYGAHDALEDIVALSKLMTALEVTQSDIQEQSFTPLDVVQRMQYLSVRVENLPSLLLLVDENVCSKSLAENVAGSGLQLRDLRRMYGRAGPEGLMALITATNADGTPRVPGSERLLNQFVSKVAAYFDENP